MLRTIKNIITFVIVGVCIWFLVVLYDGYSMYKDAIIEESVEDKIAEIKSDTENYTEYSRIPQYYVDAVVAVEDRRFFKHHGIDLISIGRAAITNIKEKELAEGGSSITQQLCKNIYFTQKKQISRKIAEIFMTYQIEKICSKEEIFELYVNSIYYGDGYYSIGDAAEGYFGKKVEDLTLYEATLLAGIPNAPSKYSPTVNAELAKERQLQVVNKMIQYDFLTEEEGQNLINEINSNAN